MGDNLRKLSRAFRTPGLSKQKRSNSSSSQSRARIPGELGESNENDGTQAWQSPQNVGSNRYPVEAHLPRASFDSALGRGTPSSSKAAAFRQYSSQYEDDDDDDMPMPLSDRQLSRYGAVAPVTPEESSPSMPTYLGRNAGVDETKSSQDRLYYTCLWRAPSTRKIKNWDGDGIIVLEGGGRRIQLLDASSLAHLSECSSPGKKSFSIDEEMRIGSKEVHIEDETSASAVKLSNKRKSENLSSPIEDVQPRKSFKVPSMQHRGKGQRPAGQRPEPVSVESFYARPNPQDARVSGIMNPGRGVNAQPLYDPDAPKAIVMSRPSLEHQAMFNKSGRPVVDVVINPLLASKLQPYQVEGIRFLYERVMCMRPSPEEIARKHYHMSAILADEMGLGKTLQTIVVIEMLLKQSCYYHPNVRTIQCALVVCDLSLVSNWKSEFTKWLGPTLRVLCIESRDDIGKAASGQYDVLITNYERLTRSIDEFQSIAKIGLLVCDEAHRLKSADTQATQRIQSLTIDRRILLSGTPLQNNLAEFYTIVDVAAPGLLGGAAEFKRMFDDPIMRSREVGCTERARTMGKERWTALKYMTGPFILRRSAKLLNNSLPNKHEQVIFCSPSPLQLQLYEIIVSSDHVRAIVGGIEAERKWALPLISALRKLCNSPGLLVKDVDESGARDSESSTVKKLLGKEGAKLLSDDDIAGMSTSGKLQLLRRMLRKIKESTDDKVVIVSNFTATLDIVEAFCKGRYKYLRMDGKTKSQDRKEIVHQFNTSERSKSFLFLMSAKTGGVGQNLIGANRIVLLDGDWNPSTDDQTMARIHRLGQKKECFIYRLLLSGTMDEKIFIRQTSKRSLSTSLLDAEQGDSAGEASSEAFSFEELRAIFELHTDTTSLTHRLLQCPCSGDGKASVIKKEPSQEESKEEQPPIGFMKASQAMATNAHRASNNHRKGLAPLLKWAHYDAAQSPESSETLHDTILASIMSRQTLAPAEEADEYADESECPPFDVTKTQAGDILHIFAKSSKDDADEGKQSDTTSESGEED